MDVGSTQGKGALQRFSDQLQSSLRAWRATLRRRRLRRLENVWLLCWLLKDLGWVLLCAPIAWPAAMAAITLQSFDLLQQWEALPVGEWVHSLATLAWTCGNAVWMTAQLLYEPDVHKSRTSPWYSGAIFSANAEHYRLGRALMQTMDVATLLGLVLFYASIVRRGRDADVVGDPTTDAIRQRKASLADAPVAGTDAETRSAQVLVFGVLTPEVYAKIFIVPWILKDLFWSMQSFIPAILCMLLVTVLMADYLWLFMKWRSFAMFLWSTGSAVWLSNDLVMHEQEIWPLFLSVLFFAVAACILGAVVLARPPREAEFLDADAKESDPLL